MARTLVCCNVLNQIHNAAYMAHCNMWYRLGKWAEKTGDEFISFFPYRTSIDMARNQAAKFALEQDCDYLFFYDDDSCPNADTYKSLREADKDIVMAHTFIRGGKFPPMFFKWLDPETQTMLSYYNDWEEHVGQDGLLEVAAVGFSTVLIKTEVLKKIQPPYFVTGSGMTEDVYFCLKLIKKGHKPSIFVDCKVPAGHILNPEIVEMKNVAKIREFYGVKPDPGNVIDMDEKDILQWMDTLK